METDVPTAGARRFGAYLKRIRENRRLSLDTVEEMTTAYPERVTKSHLSRIENGRAVPTFPRLIALGQVYGVPIARLAERYELEYVRDAAPPEIADRPMDAVIEDVRGLRHSGRYADAYGILGALLDRERSIRPSDDPALVDLRLQLVSCLTHLGRLETAKQEVEEILSLRTLTPQQRVLALELFVSAAFRLGRLAIAELALDQALSEAKALSGPSRVAADLAFLRGNIRFATDRFEEAAASYEEAMSTYELLSVTFEACRAKIVLAGARIRMGDVATAEQNLNEALAEAEAAGFDRHRALALSLLATAAYRRGDMRTAESHALRANALARSRDFPVLIFRNCFYLWKIAEATGDDQAVRMNVRSLKTYLGRVEESLPEVDEFRRFLERGEA